MIVNIEVYLLFVKEKDFLLGVEEVEEFVLREPIPIQVGQELAISAWQKKPQFYLQTVMKRLIREVKFYHNAGINSSIYLITACFLIQTL